MKGKTLALVLCVLLLATAMVGAGWYLLSSPPPRTELPGLPESTELATDAPRASGGETRLSAPSSADPAATTDDEEQELSLTSRSGTGRRAAEGIEAPAPDFANPIWIRGRVVVPDDAPAETGMQVVAIGRREEEVHRAPVDEEGRFRVAFPSSTLRGRVELIADWLYLEREPRVRPKRHSGDLVLEPKIGGQIAGRIDLPADAPLGLVDLTEIQVEIGGGSKGEMGEVMAIFGGSMRSETLSPDGHFRFGGLRPDWIYGLRATSGRYAPLRESGINVKSREVTEVEFEFEMGASLSGWVYDAAGMPVAGALVRTDPPHDPLVFLSGPLKTDKDGYYEINGLPAGERAVLAWKDGYNVVREDVGELERLDVRDGVNLTLVTGDKLHGRVLWEDGEPAVGIDVEVEPEFNVRGSYWFFRDRDFNTETNAEGRFEVSGLPGGTMKVRAESSRRAASNAGRSSKASVVREGVDPALGETVLVLDPGGIVAGRVQDAEGDLLTRFQVHARPVEAGTGLFDYTDRVNRPFRSAEGTFELEGLRAGQWMISASADGYSKSKEVPVTLPAGADSLTFKLDRMATVRGRVFDPEGKPFPEGEVTARTMKIGEEGREEQVGSDSAPVDEDGNFELDEVHPGRVKLTASGGAHAESLPVEIELLAAQTREDIELTLRAGGRVTGNLHPDVSPLDDRRVWISGPESQSTRTDESGQFEFSNLEPGEYRAQVAPPRMGGGNFFFGRNDVGDYVAVPPARLTVTDGGVTHVVLGAPSPEAVELTGLLTRGGTPQPGRRVQILPVERGEGDERNHTNVRVTTDERGLFDAEVRQPGEYRFSVSTVSGGNARFEQQIEGKTTEVRLELPDGSLSGKVTDRTGAPLSGVPLSLQSLSRPKDGPQVSGNMRVESDGAGLYRFAELPEGRYRIRAGGAERPGRSSSGASHAVRISPEIELGKDESRDDVDFELDEPGRVGVRVYNPDGSPAQGARVWPLDAAGERLYSSANWTTDRQGRTQLPGLPPGTVQVVAQKDDMNAQLSGVVVISGELQTVELHLAP